jgi:hypothetical protein
LIAFIDISPLYILVSFFQEYGHLPAEALRAGVHESVCHVLLFSNQSNVNIFFLPEKYPTSGNVFSSGYWGNLCGTCLCITEPGSFRPHQ